MRFFGNSNLLKNIGSIGLVNIVGSLISAFFWIYLAGLMGSEQYGLLAYYLSIAGIFTSVSLIGGPMVITVFTAKKIPLTSTICLISISTSILCSVILYFVLNNVGISVYVIGAIIYNLSVSELLGRKFYKTYSIYFILQKTLFVVFSLILYYVMGPSGVLVGTGLSFLLFTTRVYRSFRDARINFQLLKTKWSFIANNFVLDLSYVVNGQIDKLFIGPMFGFMTLGNYYLGIQVLNMLAIIPESIRKYTLPEDSSGANTKKIKIITVFFSGFLALIGIFIVPQIFPIIFPAYTESLDLIPIISISIIPTTISTMYISHFLAKEQSFYILITSIVSIITMVLGIFTLGSLFGIIGLAFSLVLSDVSRAVMLSMIHLYQKRTLSKF